MNRALFALSVQTNSIFIQGDHLQQQCYKQGRTDSRNKNRIYQNCNRILQPKIVQRIPAKKKNHLTDSVVQSQ